MKISLAVLFLPLLAFQASCFEYDKHWTVLAENSGNSHTAMDTNRNLYVFSVFQSSSVSFYSASPSELVTRQANSSLNTITLVKYFPNGNFSWAAHVTSSGTFTPQTILTDGFGDVYLVAALSGQQFTAFHRTQQNAFQWTTIGTASDYSFVLKYSSTGEFMWSVVFETTQFWTRFGLAYDGRQDLWASVSFSGTVTRIYQGNTVFSTYNPPRETSKFHLTAVNIKLDGNIGNVIRIESDSRFSHSIINVAADPASPDIFVLGYFNFTQTIFVWTVTNLTTNITYQRVPYYTSCVLKLSPTGVVKKALQVSYASLYASAIAIIVTNSRNVAILGAASTIETDSMFKIDDLHANKTLLSNNQYQNQSLITFLLKFSIDLDLIWTNFYSGFDNSRSRYYLQSDSFDNIFFTLPLRRLNSAQITGTSNYTAKIITTPSTIFNSSSWLFVANTVGSTRGLLSIEAGFFGQFAVDNRSEWLYITGSKSLSNSTFRMVNSGLSYIQDIEMGARAGVVVMRLARQSSSLRTTTQLSTTNSPSEIMNQISTNSPSTVLTIQNTPSPAVTSSLSTISNDDKVSTSHPSSISNADAFSTTSDSEAPPAKSPVKWTEYLFYALISMVVTFLFIIGTWTYVLRRRMARAREMTVDVYSTKLSTNLATYLTGTYQYQHNQNGLQSNMTTLVSPGTNWTTGYTHQSWTNGYANYQNYQWPESHN